MVSLICSLIFPYKGLNKATNEKINEEDIEEIMNLVDLDASGGIDYSGLNINKKTS